MPRHMRTLHWVCKAADRTALFHFLHDDLGMHALRHEEFSEGCQAACNGPYAGRWSKTMTGYGPEDSNFVIEVTYNYGVKAYDVGNDLEYIEVVSRAAYAAVTEAGIGREVELRTVVVKKEALTFRVVGEDAHPDIGPLATLCLNVTDLARSAAFWVGLCGFLEVDRGDDFVALSCSATSATLRLRQLPAGETLRRGTGYGRIAFSCPAEELPALQAAAAAAGRAVLTPLTTLHTPGKASVQVVILADPDGHEVCFVGDEAFRKLSQVDEAAAQLLGEAIAKDDSVEWFAKKAAARGPTAERAAGKAAVKPAGH